MGKGKRQRANGRRRPAMEIIRTLLDGVLILIPKVFDDDRGFFMETYHKEKYINLGMSVDFVQDNLSFSCAGTLRGLHYQHPHGQAKLVQVLNRPCFRCNSGYSQGSPTFGNGSVFIFRMTTSVRSLSRKGLPTVFVWSATPPCSSTNAAISMRPNARGGFCGPT